MKNFITNRLRTIASMIAFEDVVCDIGTDHGYTPIYICKDLKASKVFASDINEKPLAVAKDNIRNFGVDHKVELFLSDGLNFIIEKNLHIDSCIISGLGANTILKILEKDSKLIDCYIISANNGVDKIRSWIKTNKFFIENEIIIEDNDIFYEIIKINKYAGYKIKNKYDLLFGPILLKTSTREFVSNWARIEEKYRDIYQAIKSYNFKKAKDYKTKLKMINKVISKEILKYV